MEADTEVEEPVQIERQNEEEEIRQITLFIMVYKCYFLIVLSKLNDEYVYIAIIILFRNKSIRRIKRKEKMKRFFFL